jgi:hypothetical protein
MPFAIRPFRHLPLSYFLGFRSLIILLLLGSGLAYAEWVSTFLTKMEGGYDVCADPDTIRRNGNLVKLWILYDYKTLQLVMGVAHLSDSVQLEANCRETFQRRLGYRWWSGNMGNGNVVFSYSAEGNWIPIEPRTVGHTVWSFACSKK